MIERRHLAGNRPLPTQFPGAQFNFCLLCNIQSIIDFTTQIPYGAFHLRMHKKKLNRAKIFFVRPDSGALHLEQPLPIYSIFVAKD